MTGCRLCNRTALKITVEETPLCKQCYWTLKTKGGQSVERDDSYGFAPGKV